MDVRSVMTKAQQIEAVLPALTTEELHEIECRIHALYRQRHERVLYDDAYGVWLEEDQVSAAAEAFAQIDSHESQF